MEESEDKRGTLGFEKGEKILTLGTAHGAEVGKGKLGRGELF